MDNGVEAATTAKEPSEKYLSVSIISKELEETVSRAEELTHKIKTQSDDIAKMKETLLILTGARLAFKKIVDASSRAS